jgi:aspartate racemase
MRTIGVIGGLAWPSTVDYYRLLCVKTGNAARERGLAPPYPGPHILIESLDMGRMRALRGTDADDASWHRYESVFRESFRRLEHAGAEVGIIASNTPHMRLEGIKTNLSLPVVSILDSTAAAVVRLKGRRALILGTPVTMKSMVYPNTLQRYGVEALPRLRDEEVAILGKLLDLELYQATPAVAREAILALCTRHVQDRATDVVCLACTELPLAFPEHQDVPDFSVEGFRFVNTTVAHVEATLLAAS